MKVFNNNWVHLSLIIIFSFLVYFSILPNEFVYDDILLIGNNPHIKDISNYFNNLFSVGYYEVTFSTTYRPITEFSYFLIYFLFGNNPLPFHLLSILLHGLNGVLIYILLKNITSKTILSLVTSLIFICHPAISEAVNLITFNDDLFTTLFFLITLNLYQSNKTGLIFVSYFSFLLALLSKEMAISLPLIIIIYDFLVNTEYKGLNIKQKYILLKNTRIWIYSGFIMIALLFILNRFYNPHISSPMFEELQIATGLWKRLVYLPYQYFQYIKLIVMPFELNADRIHSYPDHYFTFENIISLIVFLLIILIIIRFIFRTPLFVFGILWFLVTLLPVINIIPVSHPIAERFLYLPSAGFSITLTLLIYKIPLNNLTKRSGILNLRAVSIILILLLYSTKTISRTKIYKNEITLWTHTIKVSPKSFRAHNNLGLAYYKKGYYDKALKEFLKSIELDYARSNTHLNLGNTYYKIRNFSQAIEHYKIAVSMDPDYLEAHYNLGALFSIRGRFDDAIYHWEKVLEIDPENKGALDNIQKVRQRMGQ